MSTTDTRAAFDKWDAESKGHHFNPDRDWIVWQAATEAAKATGTAGEMDTDAILSIAKAHGFTTTQILSRGPELIGGSVELHERFMKFGQACAEAARLDADAAKRLRLICKLLGIESHVPADDETLWGAAFAVLGQVRAALEAARQPAPVVLSDDEIIAHWLEFDTWPAKYNNTIFQFARAISAATNGASHEHP